MNDHRHRPGVLPRARPLVVVPGAARPQLTVLGTYEPGEGPPPERRGPARLRRRSGAVPGWAFPGGVTWRAARAAKL